MKTAITSAALCGLILSAGPAFAHAHLKSAAPAVGSTIRQAPDQVVIGFTEGVEPKFSTITVQDSAGTAMENGAVHGQGDGQHLAVGLKPLAPGVYTVTWHATSTDTHKTEGKFTFTVAQ